MRGLEKEEEDEVDDGDEDCRPNHFHLVQGVLVPLHLVQLLLLPLLLLGQLVDLHVLLLALELDSLAVLELFCIHLAVMICINCLFNIFIKGDSWMLGYIVLHFQKDRICV